jgi:hypothetical protein
MMLFRYAKIEKSYPVQWSSQNSSEFLNCRRNVSIARVDTVDLTQQDHV